MSHKEYYNRPDTSVSHQTPLAETAQIGSAFAVDDILHTCALTTILSTPGSGRTTLSCLLAAATHAPFYQDSDSPTVLMVNAMADPILELRPRFDQIGINPKRITILDHVYDSYSKLPHPRRPYNIDDLARLRDELNSHNTYRLLIIDSIELFLKVASKPNRRRILEQLYQIADLAITHQLAVVLIATTSQIRATNPFASNLHSALSEASRTCYIFDKDHTAQRLLIPVKNVLPFFPPTRLVATLPPLNTRIFPDMGLTCAEALTQTHNPTTAAGSPLPSLPLAPAAGQGEGAQHVPDLSEEIRSIRCRSLFTDDPQQRTLTNYLSKPLQKPGPKPVLRSFAAEVLTEALKAGPMKLGRKDNPAKGTLMHELKLANLSLGTAQRAKEQLGILSHKEGKHWLWHFPRERGCPQPLLAPPTPDIVPGATSALPTAGSAPVTTSPTTCAPSPSDISNLRSPIPNADSPSTTTSTPSASCESSPSDLSDLKCQIPNPDPASSSPIANRESETEIDRTPSASCEPSSDDNEADAPYDEETYQELLTHFPPDLAKGMAINIAGPKLPERI